MLVIKDNAHLRKRIWIIPNELLFQRSSARSARGDNFRNSIRQKKDILWQKKVPFGSLKLPSARLPANCIMLQSKNIVHPSDNCSFRIA
jgi:hypothetical protein